ncbi:MAG TPA: glycosyltransferase WbuB [Cyanobacteria bacterium UBA11149]|nr:glycosyltransferase WbuB [Cyanobacteria bacterium UBA11367]HBE59278.1 glycosyltransferase WbuB [Cyanobacteria bacterium UBA11366]HBK64742.1 glycosyltransferase WbuB [Cyanobacteria bacterium UBA11166]HBR76718.1 glycosyltransferase WbuB [Cyanobacteria bacterium UBA11159]HBS68366.1 glycosyltransferase WbuB [Cyanobacteria bacterium UBA11153]HBW91507.1 glycosyltransferase WbuB [Cyanobacteria bacterium UBA11149]HCA94622.1 glycosyltransferase WbuB [Cyanobacteria bacterium UBA9226]
MRILIYSYNYAPEPIGIAPLMTELAEGLVKRGHQVRVVTGMPNYPERIIYEPYRDKWYCTEFIKGVVIQRSYVWIRPKPNLLDRLLLEASFVITSFIHALKGQPPDIILMTAPPLLVSVPAAFLARIHSCPIVLNLQDILPDAAIHVDLIKPNSKLVKILRFLEKFAYRHATKISVIADGFVNNLRGKGVPENKIVQIPNWVNTEIIKPLAKEPNKFREEHQLNGKFVVMYSGNIALTQGIETAIHAAVRLRHLPDIAIVIVGEKGALENLHHEEEKALEKFNEDAEEGLKRLHLEEENALRNLQIYTDTCKATNIKLLQFEPREKLPEMLAAADLGLVLQRKNVINFNMPSKIPVLMASGRAILASVPPDGTAASAIARSGGGILIPPEDPGALAAAIVQLYIDPDKVKKLGEKGRKYAEENYAFETSLDRYEKLFTTVQES